MPSFALKNDGAGDFSKKMDAVFGNLSELEKKHQKWEDVNAQENENYLKPDPALEENLSSRTRLALSRINDFKAPFPTQIRKRTHHMASNSSQWNRAGFQKDPQKWTKYSLADVSDYEMSDKSNTKAAMSFLAEIKKRKMEEEDTQNEKIQFNKPLFRRPGGKSSTVSKLNEECQDKMETDSVASTSGPSKIVHVMPECIVGQGGPKQKKRATRSKLIITDEEDEENEVEKVSNILPVPKKTISLNHLEDEAEDSDS